MKLAYLFPGQGAQRPGLLHALPDVPAVRRTLLEAEVELPELLALDDEKALRRTTAVQLALLVSGVACARALIGDLGIEPDVVAGHSVGAFAAAVVAEVLTLPEAIDVVRLRGASMEEACAGRGYGMTALLGLSPSAARKLVDRVTSTQDRSGSPTSTPTTKSS